MTNVTVYDITQLMNLHKAIEDGLFLFNQSKGHCRYTVPLIQSYLLYPCKHNRIRFYYRGEEPVGLITWAWLDEKTADKFLNTRYELQEVDYQTENPPDKQLWGIEFISTQGDTRHMMKTIRQRKQDLYGKQTKVHWRRFKKPAKLHKKDF